MARLFKMSIQFFLQHQGQEAAEHLTLCVDSPMILVFRILLDLDRNVPRPACGGKSPAPRGGEPQQR